MSASNNTSYFKSNALERHLDPLAEPEELRLSGAGTIIANGFLIAMFAGLVASFFVPWVESRSSGPAVMAFEDVQNERQNVSRRIVILAWLPGISEEELTKGARFEFVSDRTRSRLLATVDAVGSNNIRLPVGLRAWLESCRDQQLFPEQAVLISGSPRHELPPDAAPREFVEGRATLVTGREPLAFRVFPNLKNSLPYVLR